MSDKGINPLELIETHSRRKEARIKIYEEIYEKCCQKIRYVNDVLGTTECTFTVPYVRWGLPFYHINAVIIYIMIKLRGIGMKVTSVPPNKIYINWKTVVKTFSTPLEFTIEVDEISSSVPNKDTVTYGGDERFEKLEKEGCGGDCCEKSKPKHKTLDRRERWELEQRHQQDEIENIISRNSKSSHSHSSRSRSHRY